jgi:hypothetical protein
MSNPILNKIIFELYFHRKLCGYRGSIPIDTYDWHEAFDGMGPTNRETTFLMNNYFKVLSLAKDNFQNYTWKLAIDDEMIRGPHRVWLHYELRPECQI